MASLNGHPCRKRQPNLSSVWGLVSKERGNAAQHQLTRLYLLLLRQLPQQLHHHRYTRIISTWKLPSNFLWFVFFLVSALCSYESFVGELWTLGSRLENEEQFVLDNFVARSELDPMTVVETFYENYTNILTMAFWHTISLIPSGFLIQYSGPGSLK